jgi:protein SCO1/2
LLHWLACGAQREGERGQLETAAAESGELAQGWSGEVPPLQDLGGIGGDFALTDQDGQPFALQGLRGKGVLLFFGYTYCPDICPVTLSKMTRVYELLGEHRDALQTVFVTVDPERDTQDKLREYLGYFAIDAIGLTGSKEQIDEVVRQYGGYYELNKSDSAAEYFVDHSTYAYLIDQEGRVRFLFRHKDAPELMATVTRQLFAPERERHRN